MWPADVLEEIQRERARVDEVFEEVAHAIEEQVCSTEEMRERLLGLRFALLAYTAIEDELLPEALRTLERWGVEQIDEIGHAHVRRRGLLADALAEMEDISTHVVNGGCEDLRELLLQLRDELLNGLRVEDNILQTAVARTDSNRFDGLDG